MPSSIWILKDETEGSDPPHLFGKMMLLPSGTSLGLEEPKSRLCVCVCAYTHTHAHMYRLETLRKVFLVSSSRKSSLGPVTGQASLCPWTTFWQIQKWRESPGTLPSRAMLEVNKWQGKGYKTQTEVLTSAELVITAHSPLPFSLY